MIRSEAERLRFEARVCKGEACWFATGVQVAKASWTTYRLRRTAWRIHRGDVPKGQRIYRTCQNPGCVNPDHLCLGDRREGGLRACGENNGRSVLTSEQVVEIRTALEAGIAGGYLAVRYKVHRQLIRWIATGHTWKSVQGVLEGRPREDLLAGMYAPSAEYRRQMVARQQQGRRDRMASMASSKGGRS